MVLPAANDICDRRHPGWGDGIDYRSLADNPPRQWWVVAATRVRLINHERVTCADEVELDPGSLVWWVGSSYLPHYSGKVESGHHVFQVLSGPWRGQCIELILLAGGGDIAGNIAVRPTEPGPSIGMEPVK